MKRAIIFTMLAVLAFSGFADAKGDEIAKRFFDLKDSNDSFSKATMTIIDSSKNQKTREIELYGRKDAARGDVKDSFVRFLDPADVKNTKFLTVGNNNGDDDQRIYLPALKKARKISSSDKSGKFVGSDLFYYDMENKNFEDYTYKFIEENVTLSDKSFAGMTFYVVEQIDKDPAAPYSKTITWQNMKDNFVYKTEAYDKNGNVWKTLYVLKTQIIDGIIVPTDSLIVNVKDNSKTRLQVKEVKLNTGINASVFSIQNLEK